MKRGTYAIVGNLRVTVDCVLVGSDPLSLQCGLHDMICI